MQPAQFEMPSQYSTYAEALYLALIDDPFYVTLADKISNGLNQREAMIDYFEYSILEAVEYGVICEASDGVSGVSVWAKPLDASRAVEKSARKRRFMSGRMGDYCSQNYQRIGTFMSQRARDFVRENEWYLSILGLVPEARGKGMGAGLIRPVLDQADAAGVPTYLESFTPENMPFYRHLGYEVAGTFYEPVTNSEYSLLRREPVKP